MSHLFNKAFISEPRNIGSRPYLLDTRSAVESLL